jgi:hypothetical protein
MTDEEFKNKIMQAFADGLSLEAVGLYFSLLARESKEKLTMEELYNNNPANTRHETDRVMDELIRRGYWKREDIG